MLVHADIAIEYVFQSTYPTVKQTCCGHPVVQYFQAFDGFGDLFRVKLQRIHRSNERRILTQLGTSMVQGNDLIGYGILFGGATGCFQAVRRLYFYGLHNYNGGHYACSENMVVKPRYDYEVRHSDVLARCYNDDNDSPLGLSLPFVAVTLLDQLSR